MEGKSAGWVDETGVVLKTGDQYLIETEGVGDLPSILTQANGEADSQTDNEGEED